MEGYRIYLTKSYEVATVIARAFKPGVDNVKRTFYGRADLSPLIPTIYHNAGYFAAVVEYEGLDIPEYGIVFA